MCREGELVVVTWLGWRLLSVFGWRNSLWPVRAYVRGRVSCGGIGCVAFRVHRVGSAVCRVYDVAVGDTVLLCLQFGLIASEPTSCEWSVCVSWAVAHSVPLPDARNAKHFLRELLWLCLGDAGIVREGAIQG